MFAFLFFNDDRAPTVLHFVAATMDGQKYNKAILGVEMRENVVIESSSGWWILDCRTHSLSSCLKLASELL